VRDACPFIVADTTVGWRWRWSSFFHEIVGRPQRVDLRERIVRFVKILLEHVLLHVRF